MRNGTVRESQRACALAAGSRDNIGFAPGLCVQDRATPTDVGTRSGTCVCDVHSGNASKTGHFGSYVFEDPDPMALGDEDPIASDTFDHEEYRM